MGVISDDLKRKRYGVPRGCLRCGREFKSLGVANRICPRCTHSVDRERVHYGKSAYVTVRER